MKVLLMDIKRPGDNKDYNGGFGTTFNVGKSLRARFLSLVRSSMESFPTMSYAYIAAIFKKYGHQAKYSVNESQNVDMFDVLLIHASLIRHNEEIKFLGKIRHKIKIGVYGPLATIKPGLFDGIVDFIIIGEPEEAIIKIAKTSKIPEGRVKSNYIKDLDSLPFPDWSIFPYRSYSFSPILPLRPFTFVLASRGCPYKCSYCPYLVFGNYRVRKPENLIKELIHLKRRYGIKAFYFRDPTFSLGENRIKKIAHLIIKNNLNLKWGCETRTDLLAIPLIKILYQAGLRAIKIGVESTDHALLKKHSRIPPAVEHQEEIIKFCEKIGIKVIAFYIIGIPGDTRNSIKNAIRYSKKLNTSFVNFTVCTPIPGTQFYKQMSSKITDSNLNHYDNFHVVFKHDNLTKEEILKYQEEAICGYYIRFGYILKYLFDKIKIDMARKK